MVSWTHRHLEHTFLDMELLIKSSQVLLSPTELFTIIKVPGFSSESDGTFHDKSVRSF